MRGLNDLIKTSGASPRTVNIAVLMITATFIGFLGLVAFEVVWDTIFNLPLASWVYTVIGACVIFITTTFTSIHTSNSVEQAVKTTSETTTNASLSAQKQADDHAISIMQTNGIQAKDTAQALNEQTKNAAQVVSQQAQENTQATIDNTEATRENTQQGKENH